MVVAKGARSSLFKENDSEDYLGLDVKLWHIRDALLPKLISGERRIKDAGHFVAKVA